VPLQTLPTLLFLLFALNRSAPHSSIEGSYLARTLNGRAVPADIRIPVTSGDVRLFRLEQGLLRLSQGGRFTLYFRYHHQLVRRGAQPTSTPVMSDSESGTYSVSKDRLIFTPAKKKGARTRTSITATIEGNEIKATYVLQDATIRQPITLELRRDESYWLASPEVVATGGCRRLPFR
jgi:hypothetical protein